MSKFMILQLICFLLLNQKINSLCVCSQGSLLNPKSDQCIPIPQSSSDDGFIAHCLEYRNEVYGTIGIYCKKCQDGYNLNEQTFKCDEITINNCKKTDIHQQKCLECNEGFYLNKDEDKCVQNPQSGDVEFVQDCLWYKLTSSGITLYCDQCISGKYANVPDQICENNPVSGQNGFIQNCLVYNQGGCWVCDKGYFDDGVCKDNSDLHCLEGDEDSCDKCEDGYFQISSYKKGEVCQKYPEQGEQGYLENCAKYQSDGSSGAECLYCIAGYWKDDGLGCQKADEEKYSFCSQLGKSGSSYSCSECKDGYFMDLNSQEMCSVCDNNSNSTQPGNKQPLKNSRGSLLSFTEIITILIFAVIAL